MDGPTAFVIVMGMICGTVYLSQRLWIDYDQRRAEREERTK